jgi:hypothetical protein
MTRKRPCQIIVGWRLLLVQHTTPGLVEHPVELNKERLELPDERLQSIDTRGLFDDEGSVVTDHLRYTDQIAILGHLSTQGHTAGALAIFASVPPRKPTAQPRGLRTGHWRPG